MKITKYITALAIALILTPSLTNAQCKSYTKRTCRPMLDPFTHNGQMNTAVLVPGDEADILLTFYSGQEYRLLVCGQEQIGTTTFEVMDTDKNLIYDSSKDDEGKNYFDFKVASTQQLIVRVKVNEDKEITHDIVPEGCVSILIGFKD